MTKILNRKNIKTFDKGEVFVGYFLMGYPNKEKFFEIIKNISDSRLDILEIGIPSDNPVSDGDTIRRAHEEIKDQRLDLDDYRKLRGVWDRPIWAMGYQSELIDTGFYLQLAQGGLIDALVISDIDLNKLRELQSNLEEYRVDVITFANPEMTEEELSDSIKGFGLVYGQLYKGKTGEKTEGGDVELMIKKSRELGAKISAGFGIDSHEKMQELYRKGFDGCIVGSEIMRRFNSDEEEGYRFLR